MRIAPIPTLLALLALIACAPVEPVDERPVRLTRDPGPPPLEAPPPQTLWRDGPTGWTAEARVLAASADGRVRIDLERRLRIDGRITAEHALPPLALTADGGVVFTRQQRPPTRDLWRINPDGRLEQLTHHGAADRPIATPDGRLLHIASVDGRARWMLDGAPLPGAELIPPPAYADRHTWRGARLIFDAGDAGWWLDPTRGLGGRL